MRAFVTTVVAPRYHARSREWFEMFMHVHDHHFEAAHAATDMTEQ